MIRTRHVREFSDPRRPPPSGRFVRMIRARQELALAMPAAFAMLLAPGCNTGATPTFPTPSVRAAFGESFVLRVGDLGLVAGADQYIYLSVLALGLDSRCPEGQACTDPGHLEISFEVETPDTRTSVAMRAPPRGGTARSLGKFEIRIHDVAPGGRGERIPTVDYQFLVSVTLEE